MRPSTPFTPMALETLGSVYHVAQGNPKASDDNPGTPDLPLRTIGKAGSVVVMGDTVVISTGTYREEIGLLSNGHMYYPQCLITFKAAPGEQVRVRGSDEFAAPWSAVAGGLHSARLPDRLFEPGAYNPYALSCVVDEPGPVRPASGKEHPETLGQIWVDGFPYRQTRSLAELRACEEAFLVSADGRDLVVHFPGSKPPSGVLIELTVRRGCFAPAFRGRSSSRPWAWTSGMPRNRRRSPAAAPW